MEEIWFCVIEFTHQTEKYIMITNTVEEGDVEIPHAYSENVIEEYKFDGPKKWAKYMQNTINTKLDYFKIGIFDFVTPCYYAEDLHIIKPIYANEIRKFNEAYDSIK